MSYKNKEVTQFFSDLKKKMKIIKNYGSKKKNCIYIYVYIYKGARNEKRLSAEDEKTLKVRRRLTVSLFSIMTTSHSTSCPEL